MSGVKHSAAIFQVQESPCCARRIRVRLGNKSLCLDWKEAKAAARAMRQMADRLRPARSAE
jgi:hypothetical protein